MNTNYIKQEKKEINNSRLLKIPNMLHFPNCFHRRKSPDIRNTFLQASEQHQKIDPENQYKRLPRKIEFRNSYHAKR